MLGERWLYPARPWMPAGCPGQMWERQCESAWGGDSGALISEDKPQGVLWGP